MNENYEKMARVVQVIDEFSAVINRGSRDGLEAGERFLIFSLGDSVLDPESGEDLGRLELVRGRVEVVHLQNAMATVRSVTKIESGTKRKIYRKPSANSLNALLALSYNQKDEEIIEEPEHVLVELNAEVGDYVKPI